MVFCGDCGTKNADDGLFCQECGASLQAPDKVAAPAAPAEGVGGAVQEYTDKIQKEYAIDPEEGVCSAVRSYISGATKAETEKKTGQQQWGLFETNYQRTKGITTEESLQEIENAVNHGVYVSGNTATTPGSAASAGSGSAGSSSNSGGGSSSSQQHTAGSGGFGGGSFGSSSGGGSSTTTTTHHHLNNDKLKGLKGGGNAAAFLNKYNAKVAANYKPEHDLR